MSDIRFDGQVALVTGARGGLGRAYALELARRGAKVIVNDLPPPAGVVDGAALAVAEIEANGGVGAVHHGSAADVASMNALVADAKARWGRLDIVVANAGAVRDSTLAKMTADHFQFVVDVNLVGAFAPVKAAWELMRERGYGRIVLTTSAAGLYGNFGQANYSAAKLGVVGLMNTLRLEGEKFDIRINTIAPGAATPMTESLIPQSLVERMSPAKVAPAVAYLCSRDAPSGVILSAVAGGFSTVRIVESPGIYIGGAVTAEDLAGRWDEVSNPQGERGFAGAAASSARFMR